ncbi:MAG: S8 family serine peptidase [Thermales bacterium]|nr:S8 family serine peptidase [Thermales bacterium]
MLVFGNVIAVGASDYGASTGGVIRSSYSNFGNHIDVVAPVGDGSPSPSGALIQCGVPGGVCANNNSFVVGQGTSYASPQVAGVVGLMLSVDSNLDTASVRSIFSQTSKDVGTSGKDSQFGYGIVNTASYLDIISSNYQAQQYFTWYDSIDQNLSWIVIGNPNAFDVRVKIQIPDLDIVDYLLVTPGKVRTFSRNPIISGPIIVSSDNGENIYSSQRSVFDSNNIRSFNEYPSISVGNLDTKYYFTWNDTLNGNRAWTLVGNPSTTQTANVTIKIDGQLKGTYSIAPGKNITPMFLGIQAGPVVVESSIPVYATQGYFMTILSMNIKVEIEQEFSSISLDAQLSILHMIGVANQTKSYYT